MPSSQNANVCTCVRFVCICVWLNKAYSPHTHTFAHEQQLNLSPLEAQLSCHRQLLNKLRHAFHSYLLIQRFNSIPLWWSWQSSQPSLLLVFIDHDKPHIYDPFLIRWAQPRTSDFSPSHVGRRKWPASFSKHPCGWLWGQGSGPGWWKLREVFQGSVVMLSHSKWP